MSNTNTVGREEIDFSEINSVKELKKLMEEKLEEYHRFCADAKKRIDELRQARGTEIKKPVWEHYYEVGRDREPTNGNW